MASNKGGFSKGDFVRYNAGTDARPSFVKALVKTAHQDGSYTVQAYFYMDADGKDVPGFLGFKYRLHGSDLQAA